MQNTAPTNTLALSAQSIAEFLDGYPVDYTVEKNKIEIIGNSGVHAFPLNGAGENELKNLFSFLDSKDPEGVATDWEMHVEREGYAAKVESLSSFKEEEEKNEFQSFGARELNILEENEMRREA